MVQQMNTRGKCGSHIKARLLFFLEFFQHKRTFLSTMQALPFEGHNVAYQCKGLNQSNIVCEYEVNQSTNENVITGKQNFYTNC